MVTSLQFYVSKKKVLQQNSRRKFQTSSEVQRLQSQLVQVAGVGPSRPSGSDHGRQAGGGGPRRPRVARSSSRTTVGSGPCLVPSTRVSWFDPQHVVDICAWRDALVSVSGGVAPGSNSSPTGEVTVLKVFGVGQIERCWMIFEGDLFASGLERTAGTIRCAVRRRASDAPQQWRSCCPPNG